jgi:hypothetical protein
MITSETPYKLAEIIRDTWSGLYRNNDKCYTEIARSDQINKIIYKKT